MSIQKVGNSIREMVGAGEQKREIIPTLWDDGVVAVVWYRRLLWLVYKIINLVSSDYINNKLHRAIVKTDTLFKAEQEKLKTSINAFTGTIQSRVEGKSVDDKAFKEHARVITDWNKHITSIYKKDVAGEMAKIKALYDKAFTLKEASEPDSFTITMDKTLQARAERMQHLMNLETFVDTPPPVAILAKLAGFHPIHFKAHTEADMQACERWVQDCNEVKHEIPLNKAERETLQAWIKKINANEKEITVKDFDEALFAFVSELHKTEGGIFNESAHKLSLSLARLEFALQEQGCKIFDQVDPEFVAMRENFEKGNRTLQYKGEGIQGEAFEGEITLGARLGAVKDKDRFIAYEISEKTEDALLQKFRTRQEGIVLKNSMVVRFGSNAADLRIQIVKTILRHDDLKRGNGNGVIFVPHCWNIDIHGRAAIMNLFDRKLSPIHPDKWLSTEGDLKPEESEKIDRFIRLMNTYVSLGLTPSELNLKTLMVDNYGNLFCSKPIIPRKDLEKNNEFDFVQNVDFIQMFANGSNYILKLAIVASGLQNDITAQYFVECMGHFLKQANLTPQTVADTTKYRDKGLYKDDATKAKIVKKAEDLQKEMTQIRKNIVDYISENYEITDSDSFVTFVNGTMVKLYADENICGLIPAGFQNVAIAKVLANDLVQYKKKRVEEATKEIAELAKTRGLQAVTREEFNKRGIYNPDQMTSIYRNAEQAQKIVASDSKAEPPAQSAAASASAKPLTAGPANGLVDSKVDVKA